MIDREAVDPVLALLSVAIGMIMEDHAGEAVILLPQGRKERRERFSRLAAAGRDIAAVAAAAEVLMRRRAN